MNRIQIGDVDASKSERSERSLPAFEQRLLCVRWRTSTVVLLDVHTEEDDVYAIDLLKCEDCFGSIGIPVGHLRSEVFL